MRPPPLSPGDSIAVVSPAGPVTPELLAPGLELLRSWDLEVELHEAVYETQSPGYLAGGDATRLEALQRAVEHPEHGAVVFSRGGYGTMRLLDALDLGGLRREPKLLVGFSDLTALHLHTAGVVGVATLHGPVVKSLRLHGDGDGSHEALRRALFGERSGGFALGRLETIRAGTVRGPVLGGNLTLLVNLLSTPFCPDLEGAILVVEDVDEEDYRLDRLMTALRLSSKTDRLGGIVLGDFVECGGAYLDDAGVDELLRRLAAEFDCPAAAGLPIGHGARNTTLPMGVPARLDADAGTLTFEHGATREQF